MTSQGVDYSYARPGGAALAAAGKHFAGRYLEYSHADATSMQKFLTAPEVADLHAHGIAIVAIFESTSVRASVAGAAGGFADGTDARVAMQNLGFPAGRTVYVALQDTGLSASQFPAIATYLTAFSSALSGEYAVGGYGGTELWAYLRSHGFPTLPWWQAAAISWSGYVWDPNVAIQQTGTGNVSGCDADTALIADFGQWTGDPMGIAIKLAVTEDTNPFDALGTAHNGSNPTTFWDPTTSATITMPGGSNLGVVQLGTAVDAISATYPAGTPIIATSINGRTYITPRSAVTITPLTAPSTDCSAQVAAAVAPLNAQVSTLTAQAAALTGQVSTLQGELAASQKKIADYIAADSALRS